MAVSGVAVTVEFLVWDTDANAGKTGDSENLTLRIVADGAAATPGNSPAEIDATNLPGVYKLTLTAAENSGAAMCLAGKSGTADVVVIPTHWHNLDASILSRAAPGDEMDLVDAPNETALEAIADAIGPIGALTVTVSGPVIEDGLLTVEAPRGDTYSLVLTITEDGSALDLSGYDDFVFTVKRRADRQDEDDTNALIQADGVLSGDNNNVLTFELTAEDTEATALGVWHDCDVECATTGRTAVRTILRGSYRSIWDVTRGVVAE